MTTPERDVDRELDFHLEMLVRRYEAEGATPEEARARAMARLGDRVRASADTAAVHAAHGAGRPPRPGVRWSSLWQDVRLAARSLRRSPIFTAAALATLAVGTGASTLIFSIVNAALLEPLPYAHAPRVVVLNNEYLEHGAAKQTAVASEEFADYRLSLHAFDGLAALRPQMATLADGCAGCEPERVSAYGVSPELFDVLGVRPARGRVFTEADGRAGADPVVVISDGLWTRRFGRSPAALGARITLSGVPRTVVGIMPRGVAFPDDPVGYLKDRADVWTPIAWQDRHDGRGNQYLVVLGRLAPGVSAASARADLDTMAAEFRQRFPTRYATAGEPWHVSMVPLRETMLGDVRPTLAALSAAVAFVLLIACANVSHLVATRHAARAREFAVRAALGAAPNRLVQQLAVETLLLTTAGAGLGVGLAAAGLAWLSSTPAGHLPRLDAAGIDLRVFVFAAAVAIFAALATGLWPAWRHARVSPQTTLAGTPRGAAGTAPRQRLRAALVGTEVALTTLVLVGALLCVRSMLALTRTPTGVALSGTAIAQLTLPRATYTSGDRVRAFEQSLAARLRAIPGVTAASAVYPLPLSGDGWSGSLAIVGQQTAAGAPDPHAEYAVALPGYFAAAGIPFLAGRDFTDDDTATAARVAIVDADFARQYWPGESPLGKQIATSGDLSAGPFETVVGVVAHTLRDGARKHGEAQLYLPVLQRNEVGLSFVVRTAGAPDHRLADIRAAIRAADPQLPLNALLTGDALAARGSARDRFIARIFVGFGAIALGLAALGLYGVLGAVVANRANEIGIRLALGGRPIRLARGLVVEGLGLTAVGLVLGLLASTALARGLAQLLFEISPRDPWAFFAAGLVMLAAATAASLIPAARILRIDPSRVMRQ